MPVRGDTQINSFVKGLVTEASPLSFPPNTALDILNFKLNKDGTNYRRLGLDFEDDYLLTATGYSTDVLATARKAFYHWPLPNGNALVDIGVVQIGAKFWFLNLYAENPSNSILNGGSPVTSTVDPSSRFSFAVINNYLLVVSNNLPDPFLVSYDGDTDTITFESSPILVRDLWGVDDGLDVGFRPTSLTAAHYYNLLNQGWSNQIVSTCTPAGISAIDCTQITLGVYPSNSDVWTIGKIEDLTSADVSKYDPNIAARNIFNIGQVPQGHYILPLKSRGGDRFEQTGLTLPLDREIGTISCVASYAGRAFYSGILSQVEDGDSRSPILSGTVLFSQTFEQKIQLVKCYQEADPTSPDISDIIDTDGGIIFIPECSVINHLRAVKESLFVFAINGVWEIRGDEGGFRATSYQVTKVSNVGVYSPDSIVEINGQILFWGINGIYAIARNQFGVFETTSLTQPTIQKLYNSIPDFARSQAKGFYDLNNNTVRWLYYSDDAKVVGQPIDVLPPAPVASVVSIGTSKTNTGDNAGDIRIERIDNTRYILAYYQANSPFNLKAFIITVNADATLSFGTIVTVNAVDSRNTFDITLIDTNKILITYGVNPGTNAFARVLTISGTSITVGAENTLFASATFASVQTEKFTTTKAILTYRPSPSPVRARVLTISGDTVSADAGINIGTAGGIDALKRIDSTRALCLFGDGTGVNAVVLSLAGTLSAGTALNIDAFNTTLGAVSMDILPSGLLAVLSAREGAGVVEYTTLEISGTTLTRDASSELTSPTHTSFSSISKNTAVVGSNISVNVSNFNDTNLRYPYIEAVTTMESSNIIKHASRLLESQMVGNIVVVKLNSTQIAWAATKGSGSGDIITQAVTVS